MHFLNKHPFLLIFTTIILIGLPNIQYGQSFGYFNGTFDFKYKTINPVLCQLDKYFLSDSYYGITFSYPLGKFDIAISRARTWGWTRFSTSSTDKGSIGFGSAYIKLARYGIQASYNVLPFDQKIKLSPYLRIDYENNNVQVQGITNSNTALPSPHHKFEGEIYVETFDGGQFLPSLGLRLSINPFWRIWIFGDVFYSFGQKTYQRMYFDYTFDGIPQERAEWHSQGSGRVIMVGIGVNFGKKNNLWQSIMMKND